MTRGRRALRLLAQMGREIGILMVVFAPLESVFADKPIDDGRLITVMATAIVAIACGILIESKE